MFLSSIMIIVLWSINYGSWDFWLINYGSMVHYGSVNGNGMKYLNVIVENVLQVFGGCGVP